MIDNAVCRYHYTEEYWYSNYISDGNIKDMMRCMRVGERLYAGGGATVMGILNFIHLMIMEMERGMKMGAIMAR